MDVEMMAMVIIDNDEGCGADVDDSKPLLVELLDEDMLLIDIQLLEAFLPQLLGSPRLGSKVGHY